MTTNWQLGDCLPDKGRLRWEIHGIKRGGMGVVYIVYDRELPQAFAAKTFRDEVFERNPAIADRFMQEALAWVNLDVHPNVVEARMVQVIEGKPFLFLEYVAGGDLSVWIGTPRLTQDLPQVLRFALQFCDGMTHVLSKELHAHRDIKPHNCLVTEDRVLKVSDFGLAKVFDDAGLSSSKADLESPEAESRLPLTRGGLGTPAYMAPEQFDDPRRVDVRADVYSFGVMFYEMASGRLPFLRNSAARTGLAEWSRIHHTEPPPSLNSGTGFDSLVETCLSKDPNARFQDFSSLRVEVSKLYEEATGGVAPQPTREQDLDAIQWNNKGLSLGALGKREDSIACLRKATEIAPQYAEAWSNLGVALSQMGRSDEALNCYETALEQNPRLAEAWNNKAISLTQLKRPEEALRCIERAIEINSRYDRAWLNKANVLGTLNRYEDALGCAEHAIALNPRAEQAWVNKAVALAGLNRHEEAIVCLDRALELNPMLVEAWYNKGKEFGALNRHDEALTCYDKAIECDPSYEQTRSNKAVALIALHRFSDAIDCLDEALKLNPKDQQAWLNRGVALGGQEKREEAMACYDHALDINPKNADAWYSKGSELINLGRPRDAIECYDRAIDFGAKGSNVWTNKGAALGLDGRIEEEIDCYTRAIEIDSRNFLAWFNKGSALVNGFRHYREALPCFEEAARLGYPQAAAAIALCRQMLGG